MNNSKLKAEISRVFNSEELRQFCSNIGIDYEELRGETKSAKSHALVEYYFRRDEIPNLIESLQRVRPNSNWTNLELEDDTETKELNEEIIDSIPHNIRLRNYRRLPFLILVLLLIIAYFLAIPIFWPDSNSESIYDRGLYNSAQGNYEEAIADFSQVIDQYPENTEAYLQRGMVYRFQGQDAQPFEDAQVYYEKAIDDFTQAITLNSDFVYAYIQRGIVYRLKGEKTSISDAPVYFEHANIDFTIGINLDPENADAYYQRGIVNRLQAQEILNLYDAQKYYEQAIYDLNEAIELEQDLSAAYLQRGLVLKKLDQKPEAIQDFKYYIELAPTASNRSTVEKYIKDLEE